ncbi:MAG: hypothetical protein R2709_10690 [Marmoricola sp.]
MILVNPFWAETTGASQDRQQTTRVDGLDPAAHPLGFGVGRLQLGCHRGHGPDVDLAIARANFLGSTVFAALITVGTPLAWSVPTRDHRDGTDVITDDRETVRPRPTGVRRYAVGPSWRCRLRPWLESGQR